MLLPCLSVSVQFQFIVSAITLRMCGAYPVLIYQVPPILVISFAIVVIILSMSKETKKKETKKGWIEGNEKFTDLDLLFSSSYLVGLRLSPTKNLLKIDCTC